MKLLLDAAETHLVLMALAHLSVERPGWDDALRAIAERLDNLSDRSGSGAGLGTGAALYDDFRSLRSAEEPAWIAEAIEVLIARTQDPGCDLSPSPRDIGADELFVKIATLAPYLPRGFNAQTVALVFDVDRAAAQVAFRRYMGEPQPASAPPSETAASS